MVWLGLTKVFQAAVGRNLWIDPSKYPRKYPKNHARQWALVDELFVLSCYKIILADIHTILFKANIYQLLLSILKLQKVYVQLYN